MQAIAYVAAQPVTSYKAVIMGQTVTVNVMPPQKHSKRVNLTVGTIDGTSWDTLGPIGRKIIEAAHAGRNAQLRAHNTKAHDIATTDAKGKVIGGRHRIEGGRGLRQVDWQGFGQDRVTTKRNRAPAGIMHERPVYVGPSYVNRDKQQPTLFDLCSGIQTTASSPVDKGGSLIPQRGTMANGKPVTYWRPDLVH